MADISKLIAKLEAADRPSRELDGEIFDALGWERNPHLMDYHPYDFASSSSRRSRFTFVNRSGVPFEYKKMVPQYTLDDKERAEAIAALKAKQGQGRDLNGGDDG